MTTRNESPDAWRARSADLMRRRKRCACDPLDTREEDGVLRCGVCDQRMLTEDEAMRVAAE